MKFDWLNDWSRGSWFIESLRAERQYPVAIPLQSVRNEIWHAVHQRETAKAWLWMLHIVTLFRIARWKIVRQSRRIEIPEARFHGKLSMENFTWKFHGRFAMEDFPWNSKWAKHENSMKTSWNPTWNTPRGITIKHDGSPRSFHVFRTWNCMGNLPWNFHGRLSMESFFQGIPWSINLEPLVCRIVNSFYRVVFISNVALHHEAAWFGSRTFSLSSYRMWFCI